jgi:hypothetical protein
MAMRALIVLRIASVVSVLFAAGHTLGAWQSWSPPGETDVLQAMRSFHFDAGGASRTYWDFYVGFGFIISIYFLLQGVLVWQIATIAGTEPCRARPLIASFFLAVVLTALVCWRFIFVVPAIFAAAIAACLGVALLAVGRAARGGPSPLLD